MIQKTILLIDDNPDVAGAMEIAFRIAGHRLDQVKGPEEAMSRLARQAYDAIVLDLNFTAGQSDGREGLALLERLMIEDPAVCIIVLTAHGGIRTAVAAMQAGARDFAVKPWKNDDLIAKVEAAIARQQTARPESPRLIATIGQSPARLLGETPAMESLRAMIRRVGPTTAGIAITGPSGAGRSLTAMALHSASAFAETRPNRIDFRDEGAWAQVSAAAGTVILRHVERLDELAQDRLADQLPTMGRTIAIIDDRDGLTPALHRSIATVEVAVPPLAERRADIPLLARHFLHSAAEKFGRPKPVLTEAAGEAIRGAEWSDEVRGLALAMERAVLLAEDGMIDVATLALPDRTEPGAGPSTTKLQRNFDLDDNERALIEAALREHRHNISHAARTLGLSRGALYRRMERYGL